MNKLLLLATSLISLTIQSQGATHPPKETRIGHYTTNSDSLIKDQPLNNSKDGFKNLFEDENSNGNSLVKLNPKAVNFVQDYVEDNSNRLNKMKTWGKPYFDMIGQVFTAFGLPVELKYLSVIESDLKATATSWAGAVGPWQFMPQTARDYGLTVNRKKDERRDYKKSTKAAAKYLSELYNIYNDWLLVVAAYNTGAGNVNSAIRRSGSRNFWEMQNYLPAETRNHVKKFIATHYIMEGDVGLTTLTKKETDALILASQTTADASAPMVTITGKYTAYAIASTLLMNITEFNSLNPNLDKSLASNGRYDLRLPADKMKTFLTSKEKIMDESIRQMLQTASR
jgi:membrane-bound lytic murein transglycosylase D